MSDREGGLRARLVAVGVELVAEEGVQALTLREIARRAGVSHGAPRRHFRTHRELLSAIAREGFALVAADAASAVADDGRTPRERVAAVCRSYIRFAREHRGMYELMLRHDLLESGYLGLRSVSLPLFELLTTLVAEARSGTQAATTAAAAASGAGAEAGAEAGTGARTAPSRVVAGALWANLHGIVQLWQWGSLRLATGENDIEALLGAALDAHLGPEER
ncbi:TetR/AcrR family transcriptional regulator [Streptomyces sp. t39]|uniref:TetR/AcrR family transcriptional regulator n=1 Tax=Streptomyces sp. t39 TaxID=1828156 RepID=UPI0021C8A538|nr:TetR/AcrR family transcriptional regulator [Streptomyces sp. t39]